MTKMETEIIRCIREAEDPAKAMKVVMDIIKRICAGESVDSIAASHGLRRNKDGHFEGGVWQ